MNVLTHHQYEQHCSGVSIMSVAYCFTEIYDVRICYSSTCENDIPTWTYIYSNFKNTIDTSFQVNFSEIFCLLNALSHERRGERSGGNGAVILYLMLELIVE